MESPSEYIKQTEHAARQLIEDLKYYDQLLQRTRDTFTISPFWAVNDEWNHKATDWLRQNREQIERHRDLSREYTGSKVSRSVLAGALIQIAYAGLKLFDGPKDRNSMSKRLKYNLDEGWPSKIKKFARGREVHGISLGVIVYAARNQYNHFEAPDEFRSPIKVVFRCLCEHTHSLDNWNSGQPQSYSVIKMIGWDSYSIYEQDIKALCTLKDAT